MRDNTDATPEQTAFSVNSKLEGWVKFIGGLTAFFTQLNGFIKIVIIICGSIVAIFFAKYPQVDDHFEVPKPTGDYPVVDIDKALDTNSEGKDKIRIFEDKTKILKKLPTYFYHTKLNEKHKWFRLNIKNISDKRLIVNVQASSTNETIVKFDKNKNKWRQTIEKDGELDEVFWPRYNYLGKDGMRGADNSTGIIDIKISIKYENIPRLLYANDETIQVMRPNEFDWNLLDVYGNNYDKKELIRSLAVWANTKDPEFLGFSQQLYLKAKESVMQKGFPRSKTVELWLTDIYQKLIHGREFGHDPFFFDMDRVITIDRPEVVYRNLIKAETVYILDTLLLVGSMSNRISEDLKIPISLVVTKEENENSYFIAWQSSVEGYPWQAINMLSSNQKFAENLKYSSPIIQNFMSDKETLKELLSYGAHYTKDKVIALNFQHAGQLIGGGGLP